MYLSLYLVPTRVGKTSGKDSRGRDSELG